MSNLKKTTFHIQGMHCPSCDILISDKCRELENVKDVKADYKKQTAEVYYTGNLGRDQINEINQKIRRFGYQIVDKTTNYNLLTTEPISKRLFDVGAIAIILFIAFFFAQELNLIPNFTAGASLSFATVFILGLVASTSTCMATSGALFLTTIGKLDGIKDGSTKISRRVNSSLEESRSSDTNSSRNFVSSSFLNFLPALSFNFGRILSYGFFGFLAGLLGKTIAYNFQLSSLLTLVVSFFMLIIGLDMAKIISLQSIFTQTFTKGIFERLEHRLIKNPQKTAFLLGAITYLLPCGFTQTVQLYALGLADPVKSSLIMMIFTLGTMPALMAIGFASSLTRLSFYPVMQKVMGTLVFLIGIYYFNNFLGLYGINLNITSPLNAKSNTLGTNVMLKNGAQVATMNVNFSGYYPNTFTVKKNTPVRWEINGENVFGCQGYLVVPKLGLQKTLALGQNVIEFTPKEEGTIGFSCGMGMYRGTFNVVGS